jgi:hypothetical protein
LWGAHIESWRVPVDFSSMLSTVIKYCCASGWSHLGLVSSLLHSELNG